MTNVSVSVCSFWEWRAHEETGTGEETGVGKAFMYFIAASKVLSLAIVSYVVP